MQPQSQTVTVHPRRWAILGLLVLSLIVVVLDTTVLNVALRAIADPVQGLGATQAELEWSLNAYTLVFAGLLLTAGILGDRVGRRRILLIGLMLFGLASLASAYAQDPAQLIWARALMGVGGAAVMPSTLSIVSNVFDPRERAKAIGIWSGSVGLGVAIGPAVAGALLERFWWGSVFLINVPIIAISMTAVAILVPESRDPSPGRTDPVGVLLSIAGLMLLVYGITDAGEHGFGRPLTWMSIVAGLAILIAFVWQQRRSDHPSLDARLFADRRFTAALGASGLAFFALMGMLFFLAFYLQLVRGFTPLQAGLLMTPFAVAQVIFALPSAGMVRRFGPKAVCASGLALIAVGLLGLTFVGATTPIWVLTALTAAFGAGMANVIAPTTESVMSSLPPAKAGVGAAVSTAARQVGGALGLAVLGALLSAVYRGQLNDALSSLPESAQIAARESLPGAHAVAAQLGPAGGPLLMSSANDAFVNAMHWAAAGSALVGLLGLLATLAWLPRHADPHPAQDDPVPGQTDKRKEVEGASSRSKAWPMTIKTPGRAGVEVGCPLCRCHRRSAFTGFIEEYEMRKLFTGLAFLLLIAVVMQFFLAAAGAFDTAPKEEAFVAHRSLGYGIILLSVLTTVSAALARVPGRLVGMAGLVAVLAILQGVIRGVAAALDETAMAGQLIFGLHALNGLAILGLVEMVVRQARKKSKSSAGTDEAAGAAGSAARQAQVIA